MDTFRSDSATALLRRELEKLTAATPGPFLDPRSRRAGQRQCAMVIDLEAEECRLEILELLRDGRAVLVEQIRAATESLAKADKHIAELEAKRP